MEFDQEVLQKFNQWINSLTVPVSCKQAKKYAKYFIANHIDAAKAGSRGVIYDLFENVYEYALMHKTIYGDQLSTAEMQRIDNMYNVAYAVVWAIEHDGFDTVKYDPIAKWGMDILKMQGVKPA